MEFLSKIAEYISSMFTSIITAITSITRFSNQALGSINALSVSWGSVGYFGPVIGALLIMIIAFIVIDVVRDLL